jgi:uncharacterized protein
VVLINGQTAEVGNMAKARFGMFIALLGLSGAVLASAALAQPRNAASPPSSPAPQSGQSKDGVPSGAAGECSKLATPPVPLAEPAAVQKAKVVDWNHAIEVCEQAVKEHPGEAGFEFLLGHAYYKAKNYMQAAHHYQIAADAGNPSAEDELGILFVMGLGVVKDYQRAFELFNKGAVAGSASAMGNLGSMYANGYFVQEDDAKALEWYEKSIEAGNAFGLAQAGVMYFDGKGTPVDYKMAAGYFKQAADLGDGYSLKFLALMYERGLIGKPDPAKAAELRRKAAEIDPDSQNPNVPPPSPRGRQTGHRSSGGSQYGGSGGGGEGNDGGYLRPSGHGVVGVWADPNANKQGYTGNVKRAPTWHNIPVALPRCWPFCSAR